MNSLSDAITDALLELRTETRTPWIVLDTLRQQQIRRRDFKLASVQAAAELMGLYVTTREGWLEFAQRVAARLPTCEPAE